MQTQTRRRRSIEEISLNGFAHVRTKLFPSVRLREYAFAERLGDKAAVRILGHIKYKLIHAVRLENCAFGRKRHSRAFVGHCEAMRELTAAARRGGARQNHS